MTKNGSVPAAWRPLVVVTSFIASSALIHFALARPAPRLEWLAICSLVFVPFSIPLIRLRWRAWLAFLALCAAAGGLVAAGGGRPLLYAPSIVIPAALAWFFGRTLRAGRQPLVAVVALAARPNTPDYLLRYSRQLTVFWTGIFVAMTTWDLALAVLAPHAWWSFMANCCNYLVIGAAVVLEYVYRLLRFRDYDHPGFVEYIRIVMRADPRRSSGA